MPNWKKVIVSGSDASLNSLFVLTSVTGSSFRGSFTGSLFGTASWALNSLTASYAMSSGQAVLVTGSNAILNQSTPALTWSFDHNLNNQYPVFQVFNSANEVVIPEKIVAVSTTNALIYFSTETSGTAVADIGGYTGSQASISASYAETASYALTASYVLGSVSGFPYTGSARITGSLDVVGPITATSITSSLFGTASWAQNALTASYAINIVVSGSINDVDYINFDTSSTFTNLPGRLGWDSGEANLQLGLFGGNVQLSVGTQLYQYVYNAEASPLTKGQVVFISGSQGNKIAVKLASATAEYGSANTLGLVAETISAGGNGWIISEGNLRKLNTIGLTPGALIFLGTTPGTYTQTEPVAPNHGVRLGYVERVDATVGSIYVKIDNGYELNELHNVIDNSTTSSFGDLLVKSGSVWTNSKSLTGSYDLTGSLSATSFTGSLFGTASSAISSSYAYTASSAISSSNALNANNATTIDVNVFGSDVDSYVLISNVVGTTGVAVGSDADLRYNSSTNTLKAGSISGSLFGTASWAQNSISASYAYTASSAVSAFTASSAVNSRNSLTASSADNFVVRQTITASAALINGTITAQTLVVNVVSSSIEYSSGSNIFGNSTSTTQDFTGSVRITGSLSVTGRATITDLTGSLFGTASWATNFITSSVTSASYAFTASSAVSASFSFTASSVTTLNQNVIITGSLVVGSASLGVGENTLVLGPAPAGGSGEGGQILLSAQGGTYTSASMWDNYQNSTRLLRGTNAGSDAVIASFNMHTRQVQFPQYNSTTAFTGTTLVGLLGFDSNGNLLTTTTSSGGGGGVTITNNTDNYILTATGIANSINGESNLQFNGSTLSVTGNVTAAAITSSGAVIAQANGAMYFRGGDDAELWDINVVNTVGLYGQQDQTVGSLKLGSNGGTISGRSGSIGIGTVLPVSGTLHVNGNVFAASLTGSLFGTASWATNFLTSSVTSASYAFTASSAVSAYTASSAISSSLSISSSYAFTASSAVSAFTASSAISASRAITASFALTASSADNFLVRQTLTASAALISGSGTQRLTVVGSGSTQPLFTVLGSQGELFSITDSLSGSLFSVNDISGLPIFEVFSDSTTLMGNYSAPMLITTFRTGSVSVGANTIYALPTASYDGVFVDYTIKSGSNARAGNFSAIWTGTAVNFMDNSTVDFGNTSGFVLGAQITGGNMVVTGSATTTGWTVKTIIRSI